MGIDKKPIGVIGLTNNHTLIVEELVYGIDEYVVSYISNGDTKQRKTKSKIQYSRDGRAYFIKNGIKYYLDEVMRI